MNDALCKEAFRKFDKRGRGFVHKTKLAALLQQLDLPPTRTSMCEILSALDHEDEVSFESFRRWYRKMLMPSVGSAKMAASYTANFHKAEVGVPRPSAYDLQVSKLLPTHYPTHYLTHGAARHLRLRRPTTCSRAASSTASPRSRATRTRRPATRWGTRAWRLPRGKTTRTMTARAAAAAAAVVAVGGAAALAAGVRARRVRPSSAWGA